MMSVFDYAALPPEINSGRMYVGAGSGPLLAAVAAWDGLASELSLAKRPAQGPRRFRRSEGLRRHLRPRS